MFSVVDSSKSTASSAAFCLGFRVRHASLTQALHKKESQNLICCFDLFNNETEMSAGAPASNYSDMGQQPMSDSEHYSHCTLCEFTAGENYKFQEILNFVLDHFHKVHMDGLCAQVQKSLETEFQMTLSHAEIKNHFLHHQFDQKIVLQQHPALPGATRWHGEEQLLGADTGEHHDCRPQDHGHVSRYSQAGHGHIQTPGCLTGFHRLMMIPASHYGDMPCLVEECMPCYLLRLIC
jgi:hypothetical protein